jgi:PhnB protein
MNNNPSDNITIAPWISLPNVNDAAAFYKKAFNAEEVYRLDISEQDAVVKLTVGSAAFWLSSDATKPIITNNVRFILNVPDPDAFFAQAVKAGAKEIYSMHEEHGWRTGRFEDPFGLHWEVVKQLAE